MIIIENIVTFIKTVPPMCWVGGGIFLMAVSYCIWLWKEHF